MVKNIPISPVKIFLLCSDDDGLMGKTIKDFISNNGFEGNIVLARDKDNLEAISKEIVDADVVYPVWMLGMGKLLIYKVNNLYSILAVSFEYYFSFRCF